MAKRFGYYDNWKSAILHCPRCGWKGTFEEVAKILMRRYGTRLADVVPTAESEYYLYGE
ncbi:MAG: Rdx family protein [Deltaproteobacteria bacterium]|jgi:hypothetical protein|nr:Rdx family protein [Deltaproteobacteria bacterium]